VDTDLLKSIAKKYSVKSGPYRGIYRDDIRSVDEPFTIKKRVKK
jgi:hypothetical protein